MAVQFDLKSAGGALAAVDAGGGLAPKSVHQAAVQFEALLIGQILKSARSDTGGWMGSGDDQAGESMSELAEQQVAQVLSASGAFGLTRLIEQGLNQSDQLPNRAVSHPPALPLNSTKEL